MRHVREPSLAACLLTLAVPGLCVGPVTAVRATEQLPVIVTYELKKQHDGARAAKRDPKAFWTSQITEQIEEHRLGPSKPLKAAEIVQVVFTLARDGHVVSSGVRNSSGAPDIDKLALDMVSRAQPFPPMPDAVPEPELTFVLPVRFR